MEYSKNAFRQHFLTSLDPLINVPLPPQLELRHSDGSNNLTSSHIPHKHKESLQGPEGTQEEQNLGNVVTKELFLLNINPSLDSQVVLFFQANSLFHKSALINFWYNPLHEEITCSFFFKLVLPRPRQMR